jgi:N-glycosylase/DNA lyase
MKDLDYIKNQYQLKGRKIRERLEEFKQVLSENDERIFAELAFCLCTPQSKATISWNAIESLIRNNLLLTGDVETIRPFLNAVRFCETKVKYIVDARNFFTENGKLNIKQKILSFKDPLKAREWLVENINGFGMKEASHFLRNIGYSFDLAILDVHVIKNLYEYGFINAIPKTLTKKLYLEIEQRMRSFARRIGIDLQELDLLLWSEETGIIFK